MATQTILQDMGINMAGDTIAILRHAKIVHAQVRMVYGI